MGKDHRVSSSIQPHLIVINTSQNWIKSKTTLKSTSWVKSGFTLCFTTEMLSRKDKTVHSEAFLKRNLRWSPFQKLATRTFDPTANVLRRSTAPPENAAWMSCFSYLNLIKPLVVVKDFGRSIWVEGMAYSPATAFRLRARSLFTIFVQLPPVRHQLHTFFWNLCWPCQGTHSSKIIQFLDAIASPSTYPCQSTSEWVSWSLEIAIASPSFAFSIMYTILQ